MTADERIEKLLNHFGETIEDLPKEPNYDENVYRNAHHLKAMTQAIDFALVPTNKEEIRLCCLDYICHLTDVIDRMENALMTAHRLLSKGLISCENCMHDEIGCFKHCEKVGYMACFDAKDETLTGGVEIEKDVKENDNDGTDC